MKRRERTNILICESSFFLGGAETVTCNLISRMDKNKYNCVICTFYDLGPLGEYLRNEGFTVYHNLMVNKFDIRVVYKMVNIIRRHDIDLIYIVNQPLTLFWAYIIGKLCGKKVVSAVHNTINTREALKLRILRLLLPRVTRVITVAEMQRNYLINHLKLNKNRVTTIYNGIDARKFGASINIDQMKQTLGLTADSKTVGIVCRLSHIKGIDVFLNAAREILKLRDKIQFVIIGDGPEMSKMRSLTVDLGIEEKVYFLGVRKDVNECVAIFDVGVLCSRTEALPLVLLEYMASGKPVVATKVGSVSEVVEDGITGFLVERENPHAVAEKILYILNNEEVARRMGNQARKIVEGRFTIEATVKRTEELIDDLLEAPS